LSRARVTVVERALENDKGRSKVVERSETPADWSETLEAGPRVDLERLVDELEARVEASKQILNHAVWVDLDEFFELTRRIKANLPDEIKRAARVSREGNRIVEDAREEARRMLDEARAEAERLVRTARAEAEHLIETGEIQRLATERATQLVAQAEQRADGVRQGANAYAREILANLEATVQRILEAVENGKQQLQ
jgi:cell division septum initiation protein DivIVA